MIYARELPWFYFLFVQLSAEINNCLFVLAVLDRSLVASCKDSIGWMFSKLDTNNDLYLDQAELAAINLDKYEVCIRPFFNSCDSYRDGKVSTAEWCLCFWRESEFSEDVAFASAGIMSRLSDKVFTLQLPLYVALLSHYLSFY